MFELQWHWKDESSAVTYQHHCRRGSKWKKFPSLLGDSLRRILKKSSTGWNQSSPTRSLVTILCLQTLHYTVNFGLTKNFCNLFCLRLLFFLFDDFYLSSADAKVTNFIESFTKNQHWFITEHSCFAMMTSSPFVREKQNLFWEFLVCLAQWQPTSSQITVNLPGVGLHSMVSNIL